MRPSCGAFFIPVLQYCSAYSDWRIDAHECRAIKPCSLYRIAGHLIAVAVHRLRGQCYRGVDLMKVYKGCSILMLALVVTTVLLMIFPEIATWLPRTMR
jgi:hypothetical protein